MAAVPKPAPTNDVISFDQSHSITSKKIDILCMTQSAIIPLFDGGLLHYRDDDATSRNARRCWRNRSLTTASMFPLPRPDRCSIKSDGDRTNVDNGVRHVCLCRGK